MQRADRFLVELELLLERLDLVGTHEAPLLRVLEEGGKRRVGIKGISAQGSISQHHFSERIVRFWARVCCVHPLHK
jgi:hypothetical protein